MNEAQSGTSPDPKETASVVSLLIRLVVGVVLLFAGISKLIGILGAFASSGFSGGFANYGDFIEGFISGVKDSWAYNWPFRALMYPFFALLPWVEAGLGLLVSIGYRTRTVLIIAAVAPPQAGLT